MSVRVLFAILIVMILVGLCGIGVWLGYFGGSVPLSTSYSLARQYRPLGKPTNITGILRAERLMNRALVNKATVTELQIIEDNYTDGQVVSYSFIPDPTFEIVAARPVSYSSFSTMEMYGAKWVIVGERFVNRDGSVRYLHFGFGSTQINQNDFDNQLTELFSNPDWYLVPVVNRVACHHHPLSLSVCTNTKDDGLQTYFDEWMNTGNIPKALENVLLIPGLQMWEME